MSNSSSIFVGLTVIGFLTGGTAARAETLLVPADGTVVQSSPLADGALYEISVEGTYTQAFAGQQADAEWGQDEPGGAWLEAPYAPPNPICDPEHDVLIDEQEYHWMGTTDGQCLRVHNYSPSHIYKTYLRGCGTSVSLRIQDIEYSDNSGSLMVTVEAARPFTVPAVSAWGLVVMLLLVLGAGTVVLIRRRAVTIP